MEILILILGYIPAILYYLMGGESNMEWSLELIASIVIPVLSIIISVFISTRSGNGKVTSAKDGLSKEHTELEGKMSKEHTALEIKISNEHLEQNKEYSELKSDIANAQNCITRKIDTAVNIIKVGWDNVIRENLELRQQVLQLQQENAALKNELRKHSEDNSESDEWEQ